MGRDQPSGVVWVHHLPSYISVTVLFSGYITDSCVISLVELTRKQRQSLNAVGLKLPVACNAKGSTPAGFNDILNQHKAILSLITCREPSVMTLEMNPSSTVTAVL